MKKDNLKRIIKQFETLIEELKSEVYSDKDSYVHPWDEHMKNTPRIINSEDDDGYADWSKAKMEFDNCKKKEKN